MDRIPGQIDTLNSPKWSKKPPSVHHPPPLYSPCHYIPLFPPLHPPHPHVLLRWQVINPYRHGHGGFIGCGALEREGDEDNRGWWGAGGGGLAATQTWRRFLLMHRKLFPPHRQCLPQGCYCQLTACKVVSPSLSISLTVSLCVDLCRRLSLPLSV